MAKDEYKLESDLVEITYALSEPILQHMAPNPPPVHVTNDRHVHNLIELSRAHVIRLCVSIRLEMDCDVNNDCDGILDSGCEEYTDVDAEECEDGDGDDYGHGTENGANEEDHVIEGGDGVDDIKIDGVGINEDYSVYGKVKDEDQDDITFDGVGGSEHCLGEGARSKLTWYDGIFVRQSFSSKDELLRELRSMAVMSRFAFKTYRSTKTLLVATCRVKGCKWKVRTGVTNEPNWFWVTKYIKNHSGESFSQETLYSKVCW
ncbi:unnamed protein product [Arabis nemorensis]|uniref:Transposase MuDR plant domain-containing protein n=1 Tax=Arabis nemorensis TaxID=586526 RepID=A0A565BT20_9BRAS|nr:unnamed protein product [Arabis nemorensis]